jgi:hypothetical protein
MLRRVIFGPLREPVPHDGHGAGKPAAGDEHHAPQVVCRPIGWHEIAGLAPLMFMIVAIGVFPRPFFEQIQPAVHTVVENIQVQREQASDDARASALHDAQQRGGLRRAGSAPGKAATKGAGKVAPRASASDKTSKKGGQ